MERKTEREGERQREKERDREIDRDRDREKDRKRRRETEREGERQKCIISLFYKFIVKIFSVFNFPILACHPKIFKHQKFPDLQYTLYSCLCRFVHNKIMCSNKILACTTVRTW